MKPVSNICASIFEAKSHAVIGVSPFNSYFSEARLAALFGWAHDTFDSFHVFVPDEATKYTLEAVGYGEAKAAKKARRQANYLLNKIRRALLSADPTFDMSNILTNGTLAVNEPYRRLLANVEGRFESDAVFRRQCLECTRWVLENQIETVDDINDAMLSLAVRYLLEEMPLFMDSAGIVGVTSSVFCYHNCPNVLRSFYEDRSFGQINECQGFLIVDTIHLMTEQA